MKKYRKHLKLMDRERERERAHMLDPIDTAITLKNKTKPESTSTLWKATKWEPGGSWVRTKVLEHVTTSPQLLNKLSFCLDSHSTSCLLSLTVADSNSCRH
jgi:hypothetical protein